MTMDRAFYIPSKLADLACAEALPSGSLVAQAVSVDHMDAAELQEEVTKATQALRVDGHASLFAEAGCPAVDLVFTLLTKLEGGGLPPAVTTHFVKAVTEWLSSASRRHEKLAAQFADLAGAGGGGPSVGDTQRELNMLYHCMKFFGWVLCRAVTAVERQRPRDAAAAQNPFAVATSQAGAGGEPAKSSRKRKAVAAGLDGATAAGGDAAAVLPKEPILRALIASIGLGGGESAVPASQKPVSTSQRASQGPSTPVPGGGGGGGVVYQQRQDEAYLGVLLALGGLILEKPAHLRQTNGRGASGLRDGVFELFLSLARYYMTEEKKERERAAHAARRSTASTVPLPAAAADGGDDSTQTAAAPTQPAADGETPADTTEGPPPTAPAEHKETNIVVLSLLDLVLGFEHAAKYIAQLCKAALDAGGDEGGTGGGAWGMLFVEKLLAVAVDAARREACGAQQQDSNEARNVSAFIAELGELFPKIMDANRTLLLQALTSDAYCVRKAVLVCLTNVVLAPAAAADGDEDDEQKRATERKTRELLEVLIERVHDVNSWVRVSVLNSFKQLCASSRVPVSQQIALLASVEGRLRDRNSFVRHAAMGCIGTVVQHNHIGDVLKLKTYEAYYAARLAEVVRDAGAGATPESVEEDLDVKHESDLTEPQIRLRHFRYTVRYIHLLHSAVAAVLPMLASKTVGDVVEAIKLLTIMIRFKVEAAVDASLKICVQAYNFEQQVRDAVLEAFLDIVAGPGVVAGAKDDTESAMRVTAQLIRMLRRASVGELSALGAILLKAGAEFTENIADACWEIAEGQRGQGRGGQKQQQQQEPPAISIAEQRCAMQLFALICGVSPDIALLRLSDLSAWGLKVLARTDAGLAKHVCDALATTARASGFDPLPTTHPVLADIAALLLAPCRPGVHSWAPLARACLNATYSLAARPELVVEYLVDKLQAACDAWRPHLPRSSTAAGEAPGTIVFRNEEETRREQAALASWQHGMARLLFVLGETSLRQLVLLETRYRKAVHDIHAKRDNAGGQGDGAVDEDKDAIEDELGMESKGAKETEAEEEFKRAEAAILSSKSVWGSRKQLVVESALNAEVRFAEPWLKSCAVLALSMFMMVTEAFARDSVRYLFSILNVAREQTIRVNLVISIGDLLTRWPNTMEPWTGQFFQTLLDKDPYVRSTAFLVASHLILNDMLKARQFVHVLLSGLVDPTPVVRDRAELFLKEYSSRDRIFLSLPDTVSALSRSSLLGDADLLTIFKAMISYIDKDKHTEALVQRLCLKFSQISHDDAAADGGAKGDPAGTPAAADAGAADSGAPAEEEKAATTETMPPPPPPTAAAANAKKMSKSDVRHSRHIAECMALLDIRQTSERVVKKLVGDACFKHYAPFLGDAKVLAAFKDIAEKVRRVVPGQKERAEVKSLIDAWEARLGSVHDQSGEQHSVEQRALTFASKHEKRQPVAKRKQQQQQQQKAVAAADADVEMDAASACDAASTASSSASAVASTGRRRAKKPATKRGKAKPAPKAKRGRGRRAASSTESSGEENSSDGEEDEESSEVSSGAASSSSTSVKRSPRGKRTPAKKAVAKRGGGRKRASQVVDESDSDGDSDSDGGESEKTEEEKARKPKPKAKGRGGRRGRKASSSSEEEDDNDSGSGSKEPASSPAAKRGKPAAKRGVKRTRAEVSDDDGSGLATPAPARKRAKTSGGPLPRESISDLSPPAPHDAAATPTPARRRAGRSRVVQDDSDSEATE